MPTDNGGKRGKSKSGANISQHAWVSYLCLLKIQFKSGIVLNGLASHVIVQSGLHQNNRVNTKSVKKYRLLISIKVCTCLFQNASHCIYLLGAITIHNVKTMHIHVYAHAIGYWNIPTIELGIFQWSKRIKDLLKMFQWFLLQYIFYPR